jgi:PAS domain S-box-containing protein
MLDPTQDKIRTAQSSLVDLFQLNPYLLEGLDDPYLGITISDPHLDDNPIVYANQGFTTLTGYTQNEVLGKNGRFLQGVNTDTETVAKLRHAVNNQKPVTVEILNYRKNRTPFWNELRVQPVRNEYGEVSHFIGFQLDVTERKQMEEDVKLAQKVQQGMLPRDIQHERLRLKTLFKPHHFVSGDLYDFYWIDQGVLFGYITDIMGHGIATALQSSALKVMYRQVAEEYESLADILSEINCQAMSYFWEDMFVATICFKIDLNKGELTYASGGINDFLLHTEQQQGAVGVRGSFLTIFEDAKFEEHSMAIQPGDCLYFMSDGLFDLLPPLERDKLSDFEATVDFLHLLSTSQQSRDDASGVFIQIK